MINVPIDRIIPLTDARDNFSKIVTELESQHDGMYVLTKGGKPAIALINVNYLAELMDGKNMTIPSKPVEKPAEVRPVAKPIEVIPAHVEPPAMSRVEPPKPLEPAKMAEPFKPAFSSPPVPPVPPAPPVGGPTIQTPPKPTIDPTWLDKAPINQSSAPASPSTSPTPTAPANTQPSTFSNFQSTPPGSSEQTKPKPVNPWPILPPRPTLPNAPALNTTPPQPITPPPASSPLSAPSLPPPLPPKPPITPIGDQFSSKIEPPVPGKIEPPASNKVEPPVVSVPINIPGAPTAPKPATTTPLSTLDQTRPVMPPPPINPTPSQNAAPMSPKPDLPPPPSNPTSIPFDEPPKTSIEPGEDLLPLKPTTGPVSDSVPGATPPQNPLPPAGGSQPPSQSAIQDIEI